MIAFGCNPPVNHQQSADNGLLKNTEQKFGAPGPDPATLNPAGRQMATCLMKPNSTTTTFAAIVIATALTGCGFFPRYQGRYYPASSEPDYVTVDLDGDVRLHGQRQIKRELSQAAIVEAAGGFAGLSKTPPKSVTLIRTGQKQLIPFTEMGQGKWKDFLLQDGDRIVVNFQFF